MLSEKEKIDLIIHSAGILDGWAGMSYEKFITDLEIIRMVEYYLQGLSMTENDLALKVISEVGPGGQFLTNMHTMQNCRKEAWISNITESGPCKDGVNPTDAMVAKITAQKEKMLGQYKVSELDDEIIDRLSAYLTENGIPEETQALCRN